MGCFRGVLFSWRTQTLSALYLFLGRLRIKPLSCDHGAGETKQRGVHLLYLHCQPLGDKPPACPRHPDQDHSRAGGLSSDNKSASFGCWIWWIYCPTESLSGHSLGEAGPWWLLRSCSQMSFPLTVAPELVFPAGPVPPHWPRDLESRIHRTLPFHKKITETSL